MLLEDDNPKASRAVHKNLDPMSIVELQAYVEALEAEIKRAQAEIAKKGDSRQAAEAFFKN